MTRTDGMRAATMFDVVIFDLDGLLVDSEPLQFEAYRKAFARHGASLQRDDWPQWHRLEASAARWIEARRLGLEAEVIRAEKKRIYDSLIQTRLKLKPGARRLVETLAQRCRLAIASGSRPESIDACLERFGLGACFERRFSATLLPRKKPWPDVYLHALAEMRVQPRQALAIEDSATGLQAASAAGLQCIVCPDAFVPVGADAFSEAVLVVDSLAELSLARIARLRRD